MTRRTPPTRWLRSRTGTPARVIRTRHRTPDGVPLYRLRFAGGVKGSGLWTVEDLFREGVRFVARRPSCYGRTV